MEGHNLTNIIKVLIVFDDMIPDIETNKILSLLVSLICSSEEKKLNNSIAFISKSYLKKPKTIKITPTYFTSKVLNKKKNPNK